MNNEIVISGVRIIPDVVSCWTNYVGLKVFVNNGRT